MNNEDKIKQFLADRKAMSENISDMTDELLVVKTAKNWYSLSRFWAQVTRSAWYLWVTFLYPIYSWFYRSMLAIFWRPFRKVWDKLAYYTTKKGDRKFSTVRGAGVLASTALFLVLAYQAIFIAFDFGLYLATVKTDEIVYLSNAQEIDGDSNLHSAQGCLAPANGTEFECDSVNSLYFRIDGNYFNQAWSLFHHGTLFFPDYVAAAIAPGWHVCTVTSYGVRLKLFMKTWDIYPYLLSATCGKVPS